MQIDRFDKNRPQITIENIAEHVSAFKRELDKISDRKEEIVEAAEILIESTRDTSDANGLSMDKLGLESIKIKVSLTIIPFNPFLPKLDRS